MTTQSHGSNDYAARLIKFKARQLCRRPGLSRSDREIIEHELLAHLNRRMVRYDPARASLNTFIDRVVGRWAISFLRYHFAEKRDPRREGCSLNDSVRDADGRVVERHETMPEAARTWQRLHDLERDVADLRERLPSEEHRQVMDALARGDTINAIAGDLGISRRVAEKYFADIRRVFDDAGLREYL